MRTPMVFLAAVLASCDGSGDSMSNLRTRCWEEARRSCDLGQDSASGTVVLAFSHVATLKGDLHIFDLRATSPSESPRGRHRILVFDSGAKRLRSIPYSTGSPLRSEGMVVVLEETDQFD